MPRRPPRYAPPTHRDRRRDESKRERDAFYSSARWMRLRAAYLADGENALCRMCLDRERLTPATIAHHVVERLDDPSRALDPANLMPLCHACHTRLHKGREKGHRP